MTRIVIIGANSAIATEVARQWSQAESASFELVGRSMEALNALASDLKVRSNQTMVQTHTLDFTSTEEIQSLTTKIFDAAPVDVVMIAHGTLPDQKDCEADLELSSATININGVSPALFAEAFARRLQAQGVGNLAVIGSVAGDRARKSNYVYGASKAFVASYVQGLQHRFNATDVRVTLIKPGPVKTPMTAHMAGTGPSLAEVSLVARDIIRGIKAGRRVVYTPRKWQVIMGIIQRLPWSVFKKLNI